MTKLPTPKGPYSPWVKAGGFIYVSGQGPVNLSTGEILLGNIQEQTRLTLENVLAVLSDAGVTLENLVKVTVYLTEVKDFDEMNGVFAEVFGNTQPARTTVVAAALPHGIGIEIDAVAVESDRVERKNT